MHRVEHLVWNTLGPAPRTGARYPLTDRLLAYLVSTLDMPKSYDALNDKVVSYTVGT